MKSKSLLLMMLLALFSSSGAWAQSAYHGYTATAGTSGQSGEGYSNLFDNSTSTKWCVVHSNNTFNGAYVEFYSADCIIPSKYVLTTANDNASNSGRNPKTWTIKAKANSGDEWTTIASETNNTSMQNVNYTPYTFNCNNSGNRAYKYFRFEISAIQSGGVMQLSELHFIATTGDCSSGGGSDDGLTVADATGTNSEIPVYGTWVDAYQHTQTIYPSSMLTDMQGGQITKLTYYLSSSASASWGNARFMVTLGTTTTSEFPSGTGNYLTLSNPVVVYSNGALDATGSTMVVNFSTPYTYTGGNLVVDIQETTTGTYKGATFYGESASIRYSMKKYNSSSVPTQGDATTFMPKTTFTYSIPHPNQIATVDDWNAFCRAVNSGYSYSGETVTMTANVGTVNTICGKLTGVNDATPKAFSGTFDGGGHTLTVNYTDQPRFAAPFKFLDGATIRNLRTSGTITGSSSNDGKVIAGLVGVSKGTTNIIGCSSNVNITSYYNSGDDVALSGLVAAINGGTLTVEGCAFEGSLTASTSNNNHNGGIVGYWYSGTHVYVRNTVFAPSALNVTTSDTGYSWTIARLSNSAQVTVENCYYTAVLGNTQGKERHTITGAGSATVTMSGTETNYGASGIKAYKNGSTQLPGLIYNGTIIAGNGDLVKLNLDCTLSSGQELDGYTASNSGSISGSGNPYTLTMPNNNTVISADISTPKYHIANSESLTAMTWAQFAASVSDGQNYNGHTIYLDEDITTAVTDMAGTSTDVQVGANAFRGTFDGQGYTLTISLTKGTSTHTAPFVYINGAIIKDLNVEGEINIGNNQFAGGLVGISEGFNTITNCKVNVTINSTKSGDGTHGGFVSLVQGGTTTFTGCAFTGKLLGANTDSWGGFVGYSRGTSTLNDCVFVPQQLSFSSNSCSTFVRNGNNFTNCYYTEAMNTLQGSQVYSVTPVSPATVAMNGTASPSYNVSGLGFYTNSFTLTNASTTTIYAKGDATLSLTLGGSAFSNYGADHGTLTGSGNSWSLAMEAYNTEISAYACYPLSNLQANGATITWDGNDASYIVELEEEVTTTEIQEILNESFEGISGTYNSNGWMPVGWYSYTTATGNNIVAPHVVNSGDYCYPHTGSGAINMESGTNATATTGNNAYVVLPLRNNVTELSFYARCESTSHKTLKVGRVSEQSVSGCNGFIELKTIFLSQTVTQYTMDFVHDYILPPGEYIAFLWNTTGSYYACGIDDVVVKGNVEVPTTTWTPVTDNATSPYTFRGLEPGSTHLARVVSECGQVSDEVEFTMPDIATITKAIEGYGNGEGKWYLLTSPLDADAAPTAVTNMIAPTAANYDLYYFKQNPSDDLEWINYKESSANGGQFSLEAGKGYLYANKNNVTLSFTGVPYQGNGEVAISYIDGYRFSGWNLVGNPFNETASVNRSFYEMNPEGTEIIANTSGTVDPMEGIFVIASENSTVTFTPASGNKASKLVIDITQGLGTLDRAAVYFKDNGILPKFQLNANHTKVYLPKNGKDYALLTAESDMGEMPVGFKAERNGSYTLSVNAEEVSFAYLHLIDNMNGNDVDLLQKPYYTFDAKSSDYTDRFTLVFATGNDDNAFAYYNNGNWIINIDGEATLQVVDVTGHILSSETISGSCSKAIDAASGVYMLRLINGNDVKVQKIVVR